MKGRMRGFFLQKSRKLGSADFPPGDSLRVLLNLFHWLTSWSMDCLAQLPIAVCSHLYCNRGLRISVHRVKIFVIISAQILQRCVWWYICSGHNSHYRFQTETNCGQYSDRPTGWTIWGSNPCKSKLPDRL